MTILDYTSYDQVRAVLGVSSDEVTDTELALPVWEMTLNEKFSDISSLIATNYSTIAALSSGSRTPVQVKFFETVKLYATYLIAQDLLVALPMFGFQSITDGKASQQRFDRWEDIKTGIEKNVNVLKGKVRLTLAALDASYSAPAAVSRVFMASTGLAVDPVTNS
jgi:hypothetical protein